MTTKTIHVAPVMNIITVGNCTLQTNKGSVRDLIPVIKELMAELKIEQQVKPSYIN